MPTRQHLLPHAELTRRRRAAERSWQAIENRTRSLIPDPAVGDVPEGRMLDLAGRGKAFVVDVPGPTADAPVVVLLHALVCTAYLSWAGAFADLAKNFRVVALDQRWHGRGIHSPEFHLEDCADDVAALLDVLEVERATIVGYSMGGAIAQLTWRRHPDRAAGLTLCSTAETFRGNRAERMLFPMLGAAAAPFAGFAARRVARLGARLPEVPVVTYHDPRAWAAVQFRSTSLWSVPEVLSALGRFDSAPWIGGVDVPTSVVVTTHDRAVPPAEQRRLAADIDGAVVFEAPAGHPAQALAYPVWSPAFLDGVAHAAAI